MSKYCKISGDNVLLFIIVSSSIQGIKLSASENVFTLDPIPVVKDEVVVTNSVNVGNTTEFFAALAD